MAASGFTPIQLYYSPTATNVPLAADLVSGELAINIADGKLYYKNGSGVVTLLAGISGYSGISGFSGFSGISGYSGSGVSGYSGFSGISGYSGFSGISGYSGFSGISGYSGYSGISGYSGYSGISGASGFSGTNGTIGVNGTSGYSGFSGYSGTNGTNGTSGFSGASGFSGTNGTIGSNGASGYSGYSGSGISGYSGSGISGFSGYSGAAGAAAASGYSGISGYSGTNGVSGYSGISGYSGANGTSGYSGISGYSGSGISGYSGSGISGYSGTSGISGYSGAVGTSGFSGFNGISGISGYSGRSGYSGSGVSGTSGYSGFSGYSGVITYPIAGIVTTDGSSFTSLPDPLQVGHGGTGINTISAGYIPFGSSSTALSTSSLFNWSTVNTRLGVGTASPVATAHIRGGNSNNLIVDNDGSQYTTASWYNNGTVRAQGYYDASNILFVFGTDVAAPMLFKTNGTEVMRLANGGGVSIGTATVASAGNLLVNGSVTAASHKTTNFTISESGGKLYFYYGATAIASMDSSGNFITLGANTAAGTP